jgi:hypothetical protein
MKRRGWTCGNVAKISEERYGSEYIYTVNLEKQDLAKVSTIL